MKFASFKTSESATPTWGMIDGSDAVDLGLFAGGPAAAR